MADSPSFHKRYQNGFSVRVEQTGVILSWPPSLPLILDSFLYPLWILFYIL